MQEELPTCAEAKKSRPSSIAVGLCSGDLPHIAPGMIRHAASQHGMRSGTRKASDNSWAWADIVEWCLAGPVEECARTTHPHECLAFKGEGSLNPNRTDSRYHTLMRCWLGFALLATYCIGSRAGPGPIGAEHRLAGAIASIGAVAQDRTCSWW
jgi:hypothetical protein